MSYSRFSHADVYVYMDVGGYLICCGCIIQKREWVDDPGYPIFKGYFKAVAPIIETRFYSTRGMVKHLAWHRSLGHDVPDGIEDEVEADDAENFPTTCAEGHVWGEPFVPYPARPNLRRSKCADCGWQTSWPPPSTIKTREVPA